MSIRVYALSTALGISSKKLLELCEREGIVAKSHASTLTDSEAERLRAGVRSEQAAKESAEAEAAPAAPPRDVIPPPLVTAGQVGKLAFSPKLSARRRRPPQHGVQVGGAEHEETAPGAAVAEEAAPPVAAPPPAEAAVAVESAPVAAAPEAPPAVEESKVEVPPPEGPPEKKPISIDEFVIEVPKALGRIEGIVPKTIPPRRGRERRKEEGEKKEAPRAHPQALGVAPGKLSEAGRKAREVARRTLKEVHKQPSGQSGILADTNRPQSGRSAIAGRRRAHEEPGEEPEAAEVEGKKLSKPVKGGSRTRRGDRIELDSDIDVIGTGHLRLERGETIRKPLGERRRRVRPERTKRADEPLAKGTVELEEPITVKTFCAALGVQSGAVIGRLLQRGSMVTINEVLDRQAAEELALEFGVELKVKAEPDVEDAVKAELDRLDAEKASGVRQPKAPVVVFMGHVDHGKTSLMDRIRQTRVAEGEAGGITQHIGAYRVQTGERAVTFLDTPGHEAFTAMRSRGAQVTDLAVLVVAADDGVMPQTEEAINHARAAKVPIVVALNKIDKPEANVQRVLGQLSEHGLVPEEWGGKTIVVKTSAVTGEGIETLIESLALEAELLELTGDPALNARGTVIEAEMREGLGPVVTLLVQDGTLRVGDRVLAGSAYGRVRAMVDDQGRALKEAGPSMPVRVSGLSSVPNAGDRFCVLDKLQTVRSFAATRERKSRARSLATRRHVTLEKLFEQIEAEKVRELSVILKADVQGSVEVLRQSIGELQHPEVKVTVIHSGVGAVNESDVLLADASDAVVIGFHVVVDEGARVLAEQKGVDIRLYSIIYQVTDDLKKALEGMLAPETREQVIGHVVVRQTFKVSRLGTVAGCYVMDGVVRRNSRVRLSRQGIVMYEGELESLKRFKDDVREVVAGLECGLKVRNFDDVKIDDVIEAIETVQVKRTL